MIYIIGIGPGGSADYLTQRALNIIKDVDEAIYVGEMIGNEIRNLFSPVKLKVGRFTFEEVILSLSNSLSTNSNFAILVPGDPSLYSGQDGKERTVGEYVEWMKSKNTKFEVVPGVSSWMALCGKIGLDMTEFTSSQSILVLSLERLVSNSHNKNLDLSLLDKMLSTRPSLALYQSYKHRNELPNILARHYNPNSKVVVGYKVSWPDEKILQMSLSEFMKVELDDNLAKHSLILILSKNSSL